MSIDDILPQSMEVWVIFQVSQYSLKKGSQIECENVMFILQKINDSLDCLMKLLSALFIVP